jgi:myo-inositol-1(or 4)-monophosphatase
MSPVVNLDRILEVAINAATQAGAIIMRFWELNLGTRTKVGHDIVTEVDLAAEQEIIRHIKAQFPDHSFYSEEIVDQKKNNAKASRAFRWVIDPLDGTINYASGLPLFSCSLAFQQEERTVLGVIYNPIANELFSSIRGRGSYLNKNRLHVSDKSSLGESVLSFMLTSHYNQEQTNETLEYVKKLSMACRGLRLYVSQAMELAYIAMGKLDGTFGVKSRGFSAAAGALILREAGGRVTDLGGQEFDNSSRSLLATNSLLHDGVLTVIGKSVEKDGTKQIRS